MSDEERSKGEAVPSAPLPAELEDGESVVELAIENATVVALAPSDEALEELKTEVLSAVRGAITDVMSRHHPALPEPELDLDFSLKEPAASAASEQAASEPVASDASFADAGLSPNPIFSLLAPPTKAPEEAILSATPVAAVEPTLTISNRAPSTSSQELALAAPSVLPVPAAPPVAARRGRFPAWTAAALLSMSGIAVGAGAAILLVDPTSTADIRDSLRSRLTAFMANLGEKGDAASNGTVAKVEPEVELPAKTAKGEMEVLALNDDLAPAKTDSPSRPVVVATIERNEASGPIGTRYSGAPVIALAGAPDSLPVEVTVQPDLDALSQAAKVSSAHSAAAFAQAIESPAKIGITFGAARRVTSLDILAALPAPVSVAAPSDSGTETGNSTVQLTAAASLSKAKLAAKTAKTAPKGDAAEPASGTEPTEPAAPLSAMARANEALRRGDVENARMLLQSESEAGQVEAMLVLARTFDPSYLKEIGVPASKADAATAERLYRAWYDQSVKLGLVSEGINLNRLIRAMAKAKP